jgi:hypothetical protein
METKKNRVAEDGEINSDFSESEQVKEDLLKTESVEMENSESLDDEMNSDELKIEKPKCINLNNFGNFNLHTNIHENLNFSKKRRSLHSTFLLLKKKLNLEQFMRKTQIDSLLKKCKSKAFKTIHEALKKCLNIKLPRLPQYFITNIKIDFNKIYLEKTIYDIYKEYKIIPSVEEFINKKYLMDDKISIFVDFLNLTFKNVFEYYVNSKQYVKDYYHIMNREGENFAILFNYISKVFIQYYTKSKGNKPKNKLKNSENFDSKEEVEKDFEMKPENINEINYIDHIEFKHKIQPPDLEKVSKKSFIPPTQFKRKPLFKRIKVKRVIMKKKFVKLPDANCETQINSNNSSVTSRKNIFEIRKFKREAAI